MTTNNATPGRRGAEDMTPIDWELKESEIKASLPSKDFNTPAQWRRKKAIEAWDKRRKDERP